MTPEIQNKLKTYSYGSKKKHPRSMEKSMV